MAGGLNGAHQLLDVAQRLGGAPRRLLARRRQNRAGAAALHQDGADGRLKLLDAGRQRRLGYAHGLGGGDEAAFALQGGQELKLAQRRQGRRRKALRFHKQPRL